MRIRRLTATFGKLREQTLELQDGLNILQAPNETGKSTWCAFLLSMFYGINTKERDRAGFLADKNRYAPWSGAPMSGRLDGWAGEEALSLLRTTRRPAAPMGEFQALYTGTADPVPGLTGANCGDALLGVSREVYARSAFIRQSGVAVSQDPGLERRIAALITSGEEDTSYSEALEALKKQLNRRRHNKTGQLPALEAELQETEALLASQADLVRQREGFLSRSAQLEERQAALEEELAALDRWDIQRQRLDLQKTEQAAAQAEEKAQSLRRRLEQEQIPENDVTGRLRGAIVNLNTTRRSAEKAQAQSDEAARLLTEAEERLSASPFYGQTAEETRRSVQTPPAPSGPTRPLILAGLAGVLLALAALFALLSQGQQYAAFGLSAGILLVTVLAVLALRKRGLERARRAALEHLFGTADQEAISALADAYVKLLADRDAARQEASAKSAAAKGVWDTIAASEAGILAEVRRFAPAAQDLAAADAALRASATLRKQLSDADKAAREARIRAELQAQQTPALPEGEPVPPQPSRGREAVRDELEEVKAERAAIQSGLDRIAGRLHATGDPLALQAAAERLTDEIHSLEREYGSIQLAMSTLENANAQLQGRFSPALGKRAAEIFHELSAQRYDRVILDRTLHVAAEPAGTGVPRDVESLSSGAADQLYLAVRLAICDLVLPSENPAPIVLDDALASFDDQRCAAALAYLRKEAERRQILLFTCHSREAAFFRDDPAVSIQLLTEPEEGV